ncbi:facilitated trehalose transporter Tret1-2 homolog [Anoplophora glabripennis]|nr:facilitated trehalose transporter Tret1-2 homolog [Anoplophora glabripennis]
MKSKAMWEIIRKFFKSTKKNEQQMNTDMTVQDFSPRLRQCYVALGVVLISISLGMVEGYSAILLPQLEKEGKMTIDYEMSSWIASIATLPTPLGCALGGLLMETIGRKTIHMVVCVPCLVGWVLLYFSTTTTHLLIGRFTTGICLGILGPPSGVYTAETSDPEFRGFLLGAISFAITLGVVIAHVLGTFISWQNTALIGCIFPIACLVVMIQAPESPTFLAKKSKISAAKAAFYWCRGYGEAAEAELQELLTRQTALAGLPRKSIMDYVKNLQQREFLKPLSITVVLFFTLQWTGINAMTFYNIEIVKLTLGDSLDVYTSMIIMDIIRLATSVLACYLMKVIGRRPHILLSSIGTTLSLFTLSGFSFGVNYWPDLRNYSIYALVVLIVYMAFVTVGLFSIPWAMMGELFPLAHRGLGSGLSSLINYAFIFSVVKPTPWLLLNFGTEGTFLLFGVVGFMGSVVLGIFLPETKNKPLHEIEDGFKKDVET